MAQAPGSKVGHPVCNVWRDGDPGVTTERQRDVCNDRAPAVQRHHRCYACASATPKAQTVPVCDAVAEEEVWREALTYCRASASLKSQTLSVHGAEAGKGVEREAVTCCRAPLSRLWPRGSRTAPASSAEWSLSRTG